jgi:hypothetical protein
MNVNCALSFVNVFWTVVDHDFRNFAELTAVFLLA